MTLHDLYAQGFQLDAEDVDGWAARLLLRLGGFQLSLAGGFQVADINEGFRPVAGDRRKVPPSLLRALAFGLRNRALKLLADAGEEVLGRGAVDVIARPSMGGEDLAYYLDQVPGAMFRLGCASAPGAPPLHSADFDLDERSLIHGARILAHAAVTWSMPERLDSWR